MTNLKTACILVNYNNAKDTKGCIESLLHMTDQRISIIVCDNASPDHSVTELESWLPETASQYNCSWQSLDTCMIDQPATGTCKLTLLKHDRNEGFASGNNLAIHLAKLDPTITHFWLLNNDTVVEPATLTSLHEHLAHSNADACGATIVSFETPHRVQCYGGGVYNPWLGITRDLGRDSNLQHDQLPSLDLIEPQLDFITGCSMLITQKWWKTVGKMSEDYFLYYEDVDWSLRGRAQGLKISWAPNALVYHKEGASTNQQHASKSELTDLCSLRSRVLLARKQHPWSLPFVLLGLQVSVIKRLLKGKLKRALKVPIAAWAGLTGEHLYGPDVK